MVYHEETCGARPGSHLQALVVTLADSDMLHTFGLPHGLPEQAYVTWRIAVRDLLNSQTINQVEHSYQFCRGFVQALQDTQAIERKVYLFLEAHVREVWVDRVTSLQNR